MNNDDIIPHTPSHHPQKHHLDAYDPNEYKQCSQPYPTYQKQPENNESSEYRQCHHPTVSYTEQSFDKQLLQDPKYPPDSPVQRQLPPSSSSAQSDASPFESRQPQTDRDYFVPTSQQLNLQQYSKNLNEQQFKQKNNQFRAQQQSCVQQKPIYFQQPSYLSPQQQSSYPQQQPPSNYQNPSTK